MKKVYYKIELQQRSPLRISNGEHEASDSDLMLDGRGYPFIPGTSLTGIIRHEAVKIASGNDLLLNRLFGFVKTATEEDQENDMASSALIVGDAILPRDADRSVFHVGRRDGVGLNEWGTAIKGAKYDFQTVEVNRPFTGIIEWTGDDLQYEGEIEHIIDPILFGFISDGIQAGARTTRGFGDFSVKVWKKEFIFPELLETWLDFSPYMKGAFSDIDLMTGVGAGFSSGWRVDISFTMTGSFSVRVPTAKTELMEDGSVPDSIPLENDKGNPVIPGTAWAGLFRHHMHDLLRDTGAPEFVRDERTGKRRECSDMLELDMAFGKGEKPESGQKSLFSFSESEIKIENKSRQKTSVTRNAVDRFTASPRNGALFTTMLYRGGSGKLRIRVDESVPEHLRELLAACICDLDLGIIAIGGETSVGRGMLKINKISSNGKDLFPMMIQAENGGPLEWFTSK